LEVGEVAHLGNRLSTSIAAAESVEACLVVMAFADILMDFFIVIFLLKLMMGGGGGLLFLRTTHRCLKVTMKILKSEMKY
jgi:hypothetical protein